ncbi:Integrase, catalytic core [Corchorus capsularis]|uniref:Integrase, catalytic core n=1 Tax=Corchorus capsularis TaxID=210143 RepID=A0A1R3J4N3_COCAP|nr:Integrase, catalytic core [Corchorus capsularis]
MSTSQNSSSALPTLSVIQNITYLVSIKLDRTNFLLWHSQLLPVLKSQDLLKYVDGSFPAPPVSIKDPADKDGSSTIANPQFVTWTRIDQMLLGWINATLSESILAQVVGLDTSHKVWSNLHSLFSMQSTARVMQLRSQLQNLQKGSSSISEYLQKVKSIADSLAAIFQPVSDTDLVLYTLSSLGPEYESFTTPISVCPDVPSFFELNSLMLHHESRLEQASQISLTNIQNTAFVAQNNHTTSFPQNNYYRGRRRGRRQFNSRSRGRNNGRSSFYPPSSTPGLLGAAPPSTNHQEWYSDTGATNHMAADPKGLTNSNNYGGVDKIIVGNGSQLSISHTGNTTLHTHHLSIPLHNVLCVPDIKKNLISVFQLTKDLNCVCSFYGDGFVIKDLETGRILYKGPCEGGLYHILTDMRRLISTAKYQSFFGNRTSSDVWHMRLGHPLHQILIKLASTNCLHVSGALSNKRICQHCLAGNMSHDFSRFGWLYPLHCKSDALSCFSHFKRMVENALSARIKILQSDGGGEYTGKLFSILLDSNGITHQLSCPHTPQQNGVAERKHRHVVEKGLYLLSQSSLPSKFWVEAFQTSLYLINRLPTPVLGGKRPYVVLFGKPPVYDHLRTFGCACYPHLVPYNKTKLEFKTRQCVFLGYGVQHKGYKCLDPQSRRIYISRNVAFDENLFPFAGQKKASVTTTHTPIILLWLFPSETSSSSIQALSTPTIDPSSDVLGSTTLKEPQHSDPTFAAELPSNEQVIEQETSMTSSSTPPDSDPPPSTSLHPMMTRLKVGIRKPKALCTTKHPLPACYSSTLEHSSSEPTCFSQASKDPRWRQAMQDEFNALLRNNTWVLVPPSTPQNIVGSKWVYRIKYKSDGSIERYKARLVAKGFHQQLGLDYDETFSPVVKAPTIRLVLSLACSYNLDLQQLDVKNAFLHGNLNEDVYMQQPQGFVDPTRPGHVCRLQKAIYGLKQAPRAWFKRFSSVLLEHGFRMSQADSSLFIQRTTRGCIYLLLYVDDTVITGSDKIGIQSLIRYLHAHFDMKDLGPLHYFLGMEVA